MTFAIHEGVWPVMITPWKEDNTPDFKALEALTNWYVEKGCDGIFAVCQSSEMHYLSAQEKLDIARCVSEAAAGRLQIVASGNTECSRTEQYRQIEDMMKIPGIGAYVLVSNRMDIKNEGEEAFRKLETEQTARFAKEGRQLLSCGGGVIKRPENIRLLHQNGVILFLDRPLEALTVGGGRPLSSSTDALRAMYTERRPLYLAAADAVVPNHTTVTDAVNAAMEALDEIFDH